MNTDFGSAIVQEDTGCCICLPTYNESKCLNSMLDRLRQVLPDAILLVIDDHSPDGTGSLADTRAAADDHIRVLHRDRKEGLGKAYADGFRHVLDTMDCPFVIQMDVDGSHDPAALPGMLHEIDHADLVLGSRYVAGGGIENWGLCRRWISRFGSFYARILLGVAVRDLTGGFKIWRRDLLRTVLATLPETSGYVFQIEMTYRALQLGARVVEHPILFRDREAGVSKMSPGIAFEAMWRVPSLRWRKHSSSLPSAQ